MPGQSSSKQEEILNKICQKHGITQELIIELQNLETRFQGMGRRHGIRDQIRDTIKRFLRSNLPRSN